MYSVASTQILKIISIALPLSSSEMVATCGIATKKAVQNLQTAITAYRSLSKPTTKHPAEHYAIFDVVEPLLKSKSYGRYMYGDTNYCTT